jgi:hypothetical protein
VNAVNQAIIDVVTKLKTGEDDNDENTYTNHELDWIPIFPYDVLANKDNPYKNLLTGSSYEIIGNIGIQIIIRMFASIGTIYEKLPDESTIRPYSESDAKNIYNAIKDQIEVCKRIKDTLQNNDFINLLLSLINPKIAWGDTYDKPRIYTFVTTNSIYKDKIIGKLVNLNENQITFRLFTFNQKNDDIYVLPLSSKTFVDMVRTYDTKLTPEPPYLLSSHSCSNTYNNLLNNASFFITDLIEEDIIEIYNQLITCELNMIDN